jgi:cell wall-associated NlpC family hydrolase
LPEVSIASNATTAAGSSAAPRGGPSRRTLAGALLLAGLVALALALVLLLGRAHHAPTRSVAAAATPAVAIPSSGGSAGASVKNAGHGAVAAHGAGRAGAGGATGGAVAGAGARASVAQVRDPEESRSFPLPASTHHSAASTPSVAAEAAVAPGAASDAQIRRELREEERAKAQERAALAQAVTAGSGPEGGSSVGGSGAIPIPTNVPEVVQRVIAGGNAIADFPYIWGGGHGSFVDHGYDCSGSVSYALAAGGLLSTPLVSGDLASWGAPGPGRWITIYANAGHTFMYVDGVWFDTAGRSGPYASRWITATPPLAGYAVRHPPGL